MIRWSIILLMAIAAAIGFAARGAAIGGASVPVGLLCVIGTAAYYFRREPNFTLCLNALAQISVFSMAFVLLTYLAAEIARPLIDARLAAIDHALGFHLPAVAAWQKGHPWLGNLLQAAYDSLLPQTAALIALLGFTGDRKPLETFVSRMIVAALVTLAVFALVPAEGPFTIYELAPSPIQNHYLEHFHGLRSVGLQQFSFTDAEGLITFPSFHTVWAIFLFMAVRHRRWFIWAPVAALNAAVIVSTMTTGWHYLTDVLAGILLAAVICLAMAVRRAASCEEPEAAQ